MPELAELLQEPEARQALNLAVRHQLWRAGELRWKLHADQLAVDQAIEQRQASREILEIARKWGKTWYLVFRATRICLAKKKARVVYGAPTYKHLEEFVLPVLDEFFEDCPPEMRPRFRSDSGHLEFPSTDSWVHFFGADDKEAANRGRGPKAEEAHFDEAGFCRVLGYVVRSVFRPSLLLSGGRTVLGSTPAEEPEHEFTAMAERAEANGNYARRTVYDNPLLTQEQISKFIEDDARDEGMTVEEYVRTPNFRREYRAERVSESNLVVMGDDWTLAEQKTPSAIREVERPQFFDAYTILDMGGVDPHGVLFTYFHFPLALWVIEDELLLRSGENSQLLAEAIKGKEKALWGVDKFEGTLRGLSEIDQAKLPWWLKVEMARDAPGQPFLRICDNDVQLAIDLQQLHGLSFVPTEKDNKRLQVNAFRVAVRDGRVVVNPRCRNTIRHWRQTVWLNAHMKTYRRNNAGEHGDLLDCAVYGNRNLRPNRNPTPLNYGVDLANTWLPPGPPLSPKEAALSRAFTGAGRSRK